MTTSNPRGALRERVQPYMPPLFWNWWTEFRHTLRGNGSGRKLAWRTVTAGPLTGRDLYTEDRAIGTAMIRGTYDHHLLELAAAILPSCKIVLDIGAYVGYHALAFAALAPHCHVYAYEPTPPNLARLEMNIQRNADLQSRIHINPVAVSAQVGAMELSFPPLDAAGTSSMSYLTAQADNIHVQRSSMYSKFQRTTVTTTTLDQEASRFPGRVGLLKLDVEGAEADVIAGGKHFLQQHRPIILMEVHSAALAVTITNALQSHDYQVEVIEDQSRNRCQIKATPLASPNRP